MGLGVGGHFCEVRLMHEKFREAWKAASYVASGLENDFPGQHLEITFQYKDRVIQRTCTAKDAGKLIEEYCQKFPLATVYYHGAEGYGFVAQIRCHCSREKSKGCCKEGRHHRAKILISLAPVQENVPQSTGEAF